MKPIEKASRISILGTLATLLVCPACRSDLSLMADRIHCTNTDCRRFTLGFPLVDGVPALIDFDRSIIAEDTLLGAQGRSTVRRGGSLWRRFAYWMRNLSGVQSGLDHRAGVFLDHVGHASGSAPLVLIVGGGTISPNSPFRHAGDTHLISCDIYKSDATDVLADGHFLPFRDASFDGVAAQAVLEHVLDPALVVSEMHRVLKPGGIAYAETAFLQQVHEAAFDFMRFTHNGHRWLFRNFEEIDSGPMNGPGNVLIWSVRYLVRGVARTKFAGIAAAIGIFWVRLFDRFTPRAFAIDSSIGVFFIGRKSERSLEPKDMIAYYRGAGAR